MGYLTEMYDPTRYGDRTAPPAPNVGTSQNVPAFQPEHSALARLMAFQQTRPGYLARIGQGGGIDFPIVDRPGPQNRGGNTIRQILRGVLAGVNTQAVGQAKNRAGQMAALEAAAKDEEQSNSLGALTDYRNGALGIKQEQADTSKNRAVDFHNKTNAQIAKMAADTGQADVKEADLNAYRKWEMGHGNAGLASLDRFRQWQEFHGNEMAGVAKQRADQGPGGPGTAAMPKLNPQDMVHYNNKMAAISSEETSDRQLFKSGEIDQDELNARAMQREIAKAYIADWANKRAASSRPAAPVPAHAAALPDPLGLRK